MNKDRRKELAKAVGLLQEAQAIITTCGDDEQEGYDNLTEGLQAADRGQRMGEVASDLADVANTIDDLLATVEDAME